MRCPYCFGKTQKKASACSGTETASRYECLDCHRVINTTLKIQEDGSRLQQIRKAKRLVREGNMKEAVPYSQKVNIDLTTLISMEKYDCEKRFK